MDQTWRHLPVTARPIATAVEAAVTAAAVQDDGALAAAADRLAALEPVRVGLVMGTAVRLLLEERHPDGLTGDDVRSVLTRTVAEHPHADPQVVLALLAGALGVSEAEPPIEPATSARHAAYLLTGTPIRPLIERAMKEIEQARLDD
jgi:hypothetical protein